MKPQHRHHRELKLATTARRQALALRCDCPKKTQGRDVVAAFRLRRWRAVVLGHTKERADGQGYNPEQIEHSRLARAVRGR